MSRKIATVATDALTEFKQNDRPTTAAAVQNGMRVEVEGQVSAAGPPPLVLAEEVEVQ